MSEPLELPQIPGYQVTGVIGRGAMGCVYHGRHLGDGQEVAIKALLVPDSSLQRALANEWEVLCRVQHPYLVEERELLEHESRLYLVMEYIESIPLSQWIEHTSRELRLQNGPDILDKVCQVLGYLHSQEPPVIVRDLKPENILLRPDGSIKLIDFGIARALEGGAKTDLALKGFASAAYAPMEQYSAQATTSPASDIYSLGATAFHLVSGQSPLSALEMVSQGQSAEKQLLSLGVEPVWASLIAEAMRIKPQQRLTLQEFRGRIPRLGSQSLLKSSVLASTGSSPWSWLALLILLCLLLGMAIWLPD